MLSHKVLTRQDVSRAASYYEDGADDYYAKEGDAPEWQGRGAEALGLAGPVDPARLRELLAGRVTMDGITARTATRQDAHSRIGIDLTFSAPKSVSLQALVGGDPAIIRAHDLAVTRAIAVAARSLGRRTQGHAPLAAGGELDEQFVYGPRGCGGEVGRCEAGGRQGRDGAPARRHLARAARGWRP